MPHNRPSKPKRKNIPPGIPSAFHYSINKKRTVRNHWLLSFVGAGGDPRQKLMPHKAISIRTSKLKPTALVSTRSKNKNKNLDWTK